MGQAEAKLSQARADGLQRESALKDKLENLKADLLEAQEALIARGNSAKESVYAERQKQREISLALQQEHNEQAPRTNAPGLVMCLHATFWLRTALDRIDALSPLTRPCP